MFIKDEVIITEHVRKSKKGKYHPFRRRKTVCRFVCDECEKELTPRSSRFIWRAAITLMTIITLGAVVFYYAHWETLSQHL